MNEIRERIDDERRQTNYRIKELVLKNSRLTIRDFADADRIPNGSVKNVLKCILGLKRVQSQLVPKTLNFCIGSFRPFHHVTSGYFLNSKGFSVSTLHNVLTRLKRYKLNRRKLRRPFQKSTKATTSQIENWVHLSVCYCVREITLKAAK